MANGVYEIQGTTKFHEHLRNNADMLVEWYDDEDNREPGDVAVDREGLNRILSLLDDAITQDIYTTHISWDGRSEVFFQWLASDFTIILSADSRDDNLVTMSAKLPHEDKLHHYEDIEFIKKEIEPALLSFGEYVDSFHN